MQKRWCSKNANYKRRQVNTAEIKVMTFLVYFLLLALFNITAATIVLWRTKAFENEVIKYFACEALGSSSTDICTKDGFDQFKFDSVANPINYALFFSVPAIYIVYFVNFRKIRNICRTSADIKSSTSNVANRLRSTGSSC